MSGQHYIKVYDNALSYDLCEGLVSVSPDSLANHPSLDQVAFRAVGNLIASYQVDFSDISLKNTVQLLDDGYQVFSEEQVNALCEVNSESRTNRLATVIAFCDNDSYLEFPIQGITVQAVKGRAVIFPAQWTHPFKKIGKGVVFKTNMMFE